MSHEDLLKMRRMLVICPLNTVLNWKHETEQWTGHLEIDIDVSSKLMGRIIIKLAL